MLEITWTLELGSKGSDTDPNNPLSRSLNRLLVDGQPFKNIGFVFYGGVEVLPKYLRNRIVRWLGVFVFSTGDRLIFFPGLTFKPTWIQGSKSKLRSDFVMDHISIERNLNTWHLTTQGSTKHHSGGQTIDLGHSRRLWFGLSIADEEVLRELKYKTAVISKLPSSDGKRRVNIFNNAINEQQHLVVFLHKKAKRRYPQEGFIHFTFIIGKVGFPDYMEHNLLLPFASPFLRNPLLDLTNLPMRSGRLSLGRGIDVQIIAVWLPGSLRVPISFTYANI